MTRKQIEDLTVEQIEDLTPEQNWALSRKQVEWMKPDQFRVFVIKRGVAYLRERSPKQVMRENKDFEQTGVLPPEDIKALTPGQIGALTPDQIDSLSFEQLNILFESLSSDKKFKSLPPEEKVRLIDLKQFMILLKASLFKNTELLNIEQFNAEQIEFVKALLVQLRDLNVILKGEALFTSTEIKALSPIFIKTFKHELTFVLTPKQINSLSLEQRDAFKEGVSETNG